MSPLHPKIDLSPLIRLQARAGGVQALEWHLAHRRSPATRLVIELVAPSRDAGHLLLLLRERRAWYLHGIFA